MFDIRTIYSDAGAHLCVAVVAKVGDLTSYVGVVW